MDKLSSSIDLATNYYSQIQTSLSGINEQLKASTLNFNQLYDNLDKTALQIEKTVKILKRSMKGETDEGSLRQMTDLLEKIQDEYQQSVGQIRDLSAPSSKKKRALFRKRVRQASRVLSLVGEVKNRAIKKAKILQYDAQFKPVRPTQRFDHWIEKQKRVDPANSQNYNQLQGVIRKVQLKNEPISAGDLFLLKQIQMGQNRRDFAKQLQGFGENMSAASRTQFKLADKFAELYLQSSPHRLKIIKKNREGKLTREAAEIILRLKVFLDDDRLPIQEAEKLLEAMRGLELTKKKDLYDVLKSRHKNLVGEHSCFYHQIISLSLEEILSLLNRNLIEGPPLERSSIPDSLTMFKELNEGKEFIYDDWKNTVESAKPDCAQLTEYIDLIAESADNDELRALAQDLRKALQSMLTDEPSERTRFLESKYVMNLGLVLFESSPEPIDLNVPLEEKNEFMGYIDGLISQIQDSKKQKMELLADLNKEIAQISEDLTEEKKIQYTIWYRQIVDHPFEIGVDLDYSLEEGNFCPRFNELLNEQLEIPYTTQTLKAKTEGLKRIREKALKNAKDSQENILIAGAGPGGLMQGLISTLQGKEFHIIESRGKEDPMRENVVVLGREDDPNNLTMLQGMGSHGLYQQADMKLLDFLGITDRLLTEGKAEPRDTNLLFSTKIKDLQEAMTKQMAEITGKSQEDLIQYRKEIQEIIPPQEGNGRARVQLTGNPEPIEPSQVYIMEGYRTKTRDLLGIDVIKESKKAQMAFAFFQSKKIETIRGQIRQGLKLISDLFRSLPRLIKLFVQLNFFSNEDKREEFEVIFSVLGRGEILLYTPEIDYFYYTMSKEEGLAIQEFEEQLQEARKVRDDWLDAIQSTLKNLNREQEQGIEELSKKFQPANREWVRNPEEVKQVMKNLQEVAIFAEQPQIGAEGKKEFKNAMKRLKKVNRELFRLEKNLKELYRNRAQKGKRSHEFLRPLAEGSTRKAVYEETRVAHSQIQRAETNYRNLGETHFYLGGDAETTTDPLSGAGLRTTLLRTVIVSSSFRDPGFHSNTFAQSIFRWSNHESTRSMREEGLNMRRFYVRGTERLERYIGIAEDCGTLTMDDRNTILKLYGKAKSMRDAPELVFSEQEIDALGEMQAKLRLEYEEQSKVQKTVFKPNSEEDGSNTEKIKWTKGEEAVFLKALKHFSGPESHEAFFLTDKELKTFRSAAAKVALHRLAQGPVNQTYLPEAWFVYLSVMIHQIKASGSITP